ncbi:MAG: DUF2318 domain-containing protein [Desulfobacterales bacterium]|nr:DUF2318 domain-containing protein [Desulfobacterales bacterium]
MKSTHTSPDTYSRKKAMVLKQQRPRNPLIFVIIAAAVIAAAGGVYFVTNQKGSNAPPVSSLSAGARGNATQISYPLSLFGDGKARHFEHKTADGLAIRYFILKSADGIVRAAFDACDVCWPENKGYAQDGGVLVCNNCGRRFASDRVNEVQGGCNPAPLTRKIKGDKLVLQVNDILQGKQYFNLGRGGR